MTKPKPGKQLNIKIIRKEVKTLKPKQRTPSDQTRVYYHVTCAEQWVQDALRQINLGDRIDALDSIRLAMVELLKAGRITKRSLMRSMYEH